MRQFLLLSLVCSLIFPCKSLADGPAISDFDKKAAATLYSSLAGKDVKFETITPAQMQPGLTRFEKDDAAKKATYALNFGGVEDGKDTRGFYRITLGEELTDASQGGWTSFKIDPKTGVEVLYKKIEKSDAEKYLNIAARKKSGRVILTIAQRRPLGESLEAASADVSKRFDSFLAQANRNHLMGAQIKMYLMSREGQPELGGGQPLEFSVDDMNPEVITVRIDLIGPDGMAMTDIKHVSIKLGGDFASVVTAKLNDKTVDLSKKYFEKNPPASLTLTLTVPPGNSPEMMNLLYNAIATDQAAPSNALSIDVGASQK